MPTDNYQQLSHKVATLVAEQLTLLPTSRFGLPTGKTPLGCYNLLATWSQDKKLDWSQSHCFALDEYLDIDEAHSFASYFHNHLYQYTNLPPTNIHNPGDQSDYDGLIAACGGLDLCVVGIGTNGHIAFNEPGAILQSWTHCIWLSDSTRKANADAFGGYDHTPCKAITIGISTIMNSHKVALIASGKHKQAILHQALSGPISPHIPASYLQKHPCLQVITDFDYQ